MFTRWLITGMVGLLSLHTTAVGAGAQLITTAPWPTFQHDNARTGQTDRSGPSGNSVKLKWPQPHKAVNWVKTQPAVWADPPDDTQDHTVYYAAGFQALCAVNAATGAKKWCGPKSGDANSSSPAIGESVYGSPPFDHTIYRGARDNKLWSMNPNGSYNWGGGWKIFLDGDINGSVAIGQDGTMYMSCGCLQAGIVFAMNPEGTLKWELPIGQPINNSAVAIASNGRLYVGAANGELFAIEDRGTEGKILWGGGKKAPGATQNKNSSPSIRETTTETIIYLGSNAGLSAFRDNGESASWLWTRATQGAVDTTAAISATGSGMLVVSSFKSPPATRTVYFLKLNGQDLWPPISGPSTQTMAHSQSPSAVIDADGNIYQAIGKWVKAFASNGTALWSHQLPADAISMALGNGVLYVGAKDSRLYALE